MAISKKRLKVLASLHDSEIDYSDIPELKASFWKKAKLIEPENKKAISIRLDNDILDWFKSQGKGYQSLINSVLRTFVQARKNRNMS